MEAAEMQYVLKFYDRYTILRANWLAQSNLVLLANLVPHPALQHSSNHKQPVKLN